MQVKTQHVRTESHSRVNALGVLSLCTVLFTSMWVQPAQAQAAPVVDDVRHYIIGGQEVAKDSYPWMVALAYNNTNELFQRQFCAGTIIADTWVLTAAHCVFDLNDRVMDFSSFKVATNATDLASADAKELFVTNIIVHPEYEHNAINPHSDLALLELSSSSGITPITLSAKSTDKLIGLQSTAIGWGAVDISDPSRPQYPVWLHSVDVPVVSLEVCNAPQSYADAIYKNQLCAGYAEGGRDSCSGDSGGPLVVTYGGVQQQVGIVSFGNECALPNYYGIYTDVPYFIGWINQYVYVGEPEFEPEQINVKTTSTSSIQNTGFLSGDGSDSDTGSASFFGLFILFAGLLIRRRAS